MMETTKLEFKGKGEHSVNQLETIIEQQKEELHQKQIINQDLLEVCIQSLEMCQKMKMPTEEDLTRIASKLEKAIQKSLK